KTRRGLYVGCLSARGRDCAHGSCGERQGAGTRGGGTGVEKYRSTGQSCDGRRFTHATSGLHSDRGGGWRLCLVRQGQPTSVGRKSAFVVWSGSRTNPRSGLSSERLRDRAAGDERAWSYRATHSHHQQPIERFSGLALLAAGFQVGTTFHFYKNR